MPDLERLTAETVSQIATCERCGASFTREATLIDGKPFAHRRRCDGCAQARDADLAQVDREWNTVKAQRHLEEREREAQACLDALAVPPLYRGVSLDTWELHGDRDAQTRQLRMRSAGLRYLSEWPDPRHTLQVLRGGNGTGKGHWCWSIAQHVARNGSRARVVKLPDLIRELRRAWRDGAAETEETTLRRLWEVPLLVIDEVTRDAFYGEPHQHLYDVVDHRVEYQRPTLLTSNERQDDLAAILRPALWSRVWGNGGVLDFGDGPDFRKRPRPPSTLDLEPLA